MLVKAVEAEVTAYIETHQHEVDQDGRRLVVRNGHARERTIVSGVGQLKIQAPRVDDGGAQRSRPRAHHRQRRGSAEDPGAAGRRSPSR